MAQTVKIISDSTCDLSKDLLEKYDITILPLHILLGETEYRDGVVITPEEIFRWSDENKTTPKTSAPSMTEAMEVMKPFLEKAVRSSVSLFPSACPPPAMSCGWPRKIWRLRIE